MENYSKQGSLFLYAWDTEGSFVNCEGETNQEGCKSSLWHNHLENRCGTSITHAF